MAIDWGAIAGGLGGAQVGLDNVRRRREMEEQRKRQEKNDARQATLDEHNDLMRALQLNDMGVTSIADIQERTIPHIKPEVMGNSPYRGPTAKGPGGVVGVLAESPDVDPNAERLARTTRPSIGMKVGEGMYLDRSQSGEARGRAEKIQDQIAARKLSLEDEARGNAEAERRIRLTDSLREPPAAPAPKYEKIVGPDGTVTFVEVKPGTVQGVRERVPAGPQPRAGTPGGPQRPPTEAQLKAAAQYEVAQAAEAILGELDKSGAPSANEFRLSETPVLRGLASGNAQKYQQAASSLALAYLRATSGSAFSEAEKEGIESSITPRIGDGPEVAEQKRKQRQIYINAIRSSAGNAVSGGSTGTKPPPNLNRY